MAIAKAVPYSGTKTEEKTARSGHSRSKVQRRTPGHACAFQALDDVDQTSCKVFLGGDFFSRRDRDLTGECFVDRALVGNFDQSLALLLIQIAVDPQLPGDGETTVAMGAIQRHVHVAERPALALGVDLQGHRRA